MLFIRQLAQLVDFRHELFPLFMRQGRPLSGQFFACIRYEAFKMGDLGVSFGKFVFGFMKATQFRRHGVLPFSQIQFKDAKALLHDDEFFVASCQLVPSDQHLLDQLMDGVAFEHPLKRCALVVGASAKATTVNRGSTLNRHTGAQPCWTALEPSRPCGRSGVDLPPLKTRRLS